MTIAFVTEVLGWCAVINFALLFWWFGMFRYAHDWVYNVHSKLFNISIEHFNAIHYAGMAALKITIFVLYIAPYLALKICS